MEDVPIVATTRQQLDLFDSHPLARATDPASSHRTVERIERSGRLESDRHRVFEALAAMSYPCTSKELSASMGSDRHMVARRLPDLEKLGWVRRCGEESRTREVLWMVVPGLSGPEAVR